MLQFATPFQWLFFFSPTSVLFSLSILNVYLYNILEVPFFQTSPGYEDLFRDKYFSEALFGITAPSTMSV